MPSGTTQTFTALPDEVVASPAVNQPESNIEVHFNQILRALKEIEACINGSNAGLDANGISLTNYTGLGIMERLVAIEDSGKLQDSNKLQIGTGLTAGDRYARFTLGSLATYAELFYDNTNSLFEFRNQLGTLLKVRGATPVGSTDLTTKGYVDGEVTDLNAALMDIIDDIVATPKKYLAGLAPTYTSASTITLPAGMIAIDSTNTETIELSAPLVLNLANSGALGLDTGAEANSTFYYVYLIMKSSDGTVSAVLSVTNESVSGSITYPAGGYDLKRQLPFAILNNASGDIEPFYITNWLGEPEVVYLANFGIQSESAANNATLILGGGTSNTFVAISAEDFIPPISTIGKFFTSCSDSTDVPQLRPEGSSLSIGQRPNNPSGDGSSAGNEGSITEVFLNSSQELEYKVSASGDVDISVWSYKVNLL